MHDVIDGLKNHSTRDAKDFVVSRIVEEAQREGTPLSEPERRIKDVIIRSFVTVVKSPLSICPLLQSCSNCSAWAGRG